MPFHSAATNELFVQTQQPPFKCVFLTIKFYSLESTTVYTVGGNIRHGSVNML